MADNNYFQHQMGAPAWLTVAYWVEGSKDERRHNVLMVGSCNSFAKPEHIEALVLSETGALLSITEYMVNMDATMFKVLEVSQPKTRDARR